MFTLEAQLRLGLKSEPSPEPSQGEIPLGENDLFEAIKLLNVHGCTSKP